MILVDTSVWIEYFRRGVPTLEQLLLRNEVLTHPWVIGELALGGLSEPTHRLLLELPRVTVVHHDEVMRATTVRSLARRGIGYVDVHLVLSAVLTAGTRLWTRDARLGDVARDLGVADGQPPQV